ncbi:hypothetical protein G9A89_010520 [Geosiphon pyriformis]|nr:hypothetical protein G9A89_010520 [Geosiphon pyriformis]
MQGSKFALKSSQSFKKIVIGYFQTRSVSYLLKRDFSTVLPGNSPTATVIEDDTYKGLFYHPTSDLTHFALSFLSNPEKVARYSVSAIGWVPFAELAPKPTPQNFKENKEFIDLLHEVIEDHVADADPTFKAQAKYQREGWLHVTDAREPVPWGRIPFPENIFGVVKVTRGKIVPGTYQPMPTHRIVNASGIFVLSDPLQRKLIERLNQLDSEPF